VLNEAEKIGPKIFSHYTDIVIFVLRYFNLNHPVVKHFASRKAEELLKKIHIYDTI